MAERTWKDWLTSPWQSAKAKAGEMADAAGNWVSSKVTEQLGLPANAFAPETSNTGSAPAPQAHTTTPPSSAAGAGASPPASSGSGQKTWWDELKGMFDIGTDTSSSAPEEDKKKGGGWLGTIATVGIAALGAYLGFQADGLLGALIGYAIAMFVAPMLGKVGSAMGNMFSFKSSGDGPSPEVGGESPAQVQAVTVSRSASAPAKEEGVMATISAGASTAVSTVKGWSGAASDYVVDKWERATNAARRMAGTPEKPISRVLDYTDSLNLPKLEREHNLPAGLLSAVMHAESGGKARAESPAGAEGLMQFMPKTGKSYGMQTQEDRFDPKKSVEGAAKYLGKLSKQFDGHVPSMLAAYNWGEGRVAKFNNDEAYFHKPTQTTRKYSPPPETQGYVAKIMAVLPMYEAETIKIAAAKSGTVVADAGRAAAGVGDNTHSQENAKEQARAAMAGGSPPPAKTDGKGTKVAVIPPPLRTPTDDSHERTPAMVLRG